SEAAYTLLFRWSILDCGDNQILGSIGRNIDSTREAGVFQSLRGAPEGGCHGAREGRKFRFALFFVARTRLADRLIRKYKSVESGKCCRQRTICPKAKKHGLPRYATILYSYGQQLCVFGSTL